MILIITGLVHIVRHRLKRMRPIVVNNCGGKGGDIVSMKCPYCGSHNVMILPIAGNVRDSCYCKDCGRSWYR